MKKDILKKKPIHTFKTKDYSNYMFLGVTDENQSPHSSIYFDVVNLEVFMTHLLLEHKTQFEFISDAIFKARKNAIDLQKKIKSNNDLLDKLQEDGSKIVIHKNKNRVYKVN